MGSFVMIVGVLISLFIAFNGYKLRAPFNLLKLLVGVVGMIVLYSLYLYGQTTPLIFTPFIPFIKGLIKFIPSKFYMAMAVAVILAIVIYNNYSSFSSPFGTFLFYTLITRVLLYYFNISSSLTILIMAVGGLLALLLKLLFKDQFTIAISAVGGSAAASLLFKTFYYLPWWLFILITLLFSIIALYIQYRSWQKG